MSADGYQELTTTMRKLGSNEIDLSLSADKNCPLKKVIDYENNSSQPLEISDTDKPE